MPRHKRVDSDSDMIAPWIDTTSAETSSAPVSLVSPIGSKTNPVLTRTGKANEQQRTTLGRDSSSTTCSGLPAAPGGDEGAGSSEALVRYRGVRVKLKSSATHISWKPVNPVGARCCCGDRRALARRVPYDEVLSASVVPKPASCCCPREHSFLIYTFRRRGSCGPALHSWGLEEHTLCCGSAEAAREWVADINARVQAIRDRPRSLLVFVNPFSGARRARQVWERDALPVFQRARIAVTVVETSKQDHAREYVSLMKAEELGGYQGLVAVGGDGMFQELVAGLLARRARGDAAAHRIRLGHIPAGSTDAVAYTLHGSRCAATAALHIALGDRLSLDCGSVAPLQPGGDGGGGGGGDGGGGAGGGAGSAGGGGSVRHFVCQAGYGFMGDVMRHSERLRWLGPGRYDVTGALQYLRLPSYRVALSYREAPSTAADVQQLCTAQCEVCRMAGFDMGHASPYRRAKTTGSTGAASGGGGGGEGGGGGPPAAPRHALSQPLLLPPSPGAASSTLVEAATLPSPAAVGAPSPSNPHGHAHGHSAHLAFPPSPRAGGAATGGGGAGGGPFGLSSWQSAPAPSSTASDGVAAGGSGGSGGGSGVSGGVSGAGGGGAVSPAAGRPSDAPPGIARVSGSGAGGGGGGGGGAGDGGGAAAAAAKAKNGGAANASGNGSGGGGGGAGVRVGADDEGWTHVEGEFSSVMCVVTPCRSDKSRRGIIPNGHLSDGRMYLVLVSATAHLPFLRFLLRLASLGLADRCTPHVRVVPITAMRLRPLPGGHSLGGCLWDAAAPASAWNVDGELLYDSAVEIAVQRGAVDVFARGPETAPPGSGGGGGGGGSVGSSGRR